MKRTRRFISFVLVVMLAGCATVPVSPSVMVLPAPGKPLEEFQSEDAHCRWWASRQSGLSAQDASGRNTASGAAFGTLVGAALGAAIGAAAGSPGAGAAVGAGAGFLGGTITGANADQAYAWEAQRRYDIAYQQCMYSKGNQVGD